MATSTELIEEKRKYNTFKNDVEVLAAKIKAAYNNCDNLNKLLCATVSVEESNGDNLYKEVFKKCLTELLNKYDLLTKTTIPAIEAKINSLTSEINNAISAENQHSSNSNNNNNNNNSNHNNNGNSSGNNHTGCGSSGGKPAWRAFN